MSETNEVKAFETNDAPMLTRGLHSALDSTPIENGKLRFTTDTGRLYMDYEDGEGNPVRTRITDVEYRFTEAQILDILAPLPMLYLASDTHRIFVSDGLNWFDVSEINLDETTATDENKSLLMAGGANESGVRYSSDITYNPAKKTLTVEKANIGGMLVSSVTDDDGNTTITFE